MTSQFSITKARITPARTPSESGGVHHLPAIFRRTFVTEPSHIFPSELISIATYLSESESRAYCILHSPTIPTCFVARNAPSQTIDNHEYHMLRSAALRATKHVGIVGECEYLITNSVKYNTDI